MFPSSSSSAPGPTFWFHSCHGQDARQLAPVIVNRAMLQRELSVFSFSVLFAWLALSTVLADVSNSVWDKQSDDSCSLCGRVGLESRARAKRGAKAGQIPAWEKWRRIRLKPSERMRREGVWLRKAWELHLFLSQGARRTSRFTGCPCIPQTASSRGPLSLRYKRVSDLCQEKNLEILEGFKFFTEALREKRLSSHNAYIL